MKRKYNTKSQNVHYWKLSDLKFKKSYDDEHVFYPLSEFQVYRDLNLFKEGGKPLKFPPELGVSFNYFHKNNWSAFGLRRIKNVIITLEWIPSIDEIETVSLPAESQKGKALDDLQDKQLKRAFDLIDLDHNQLLDVDELYQLIDLMDLRMEGYDKFASKLSLLGISESNSLDFKKFKEIMIDHSLHHVHKNRYFVALSLEEAQSLRAIMHLKQGADSSFLSDSKCAIALRSDDYVLDASKDFIQAPEYQQVSSMQCFKFFDSETAFSGSQVSILVRALQGNSPQKRELFWKEIRACRRRDQGDISLKPVHDVFLIKDEWELMESRSLLVSGKLLMSCRDLRAFDAFRAFDRNRDGVLTCSELYGGLEWLGLQLSPEDIYSLVKSIDKSGEGRVYLYDFMSAFGSIGDSELALLDRVRSKVQGLIPISEVKPKAIKELYEEEKGSTRELVTSMDESVLKGLRVSGKAVKAWRLEWSSAKSGSRKGVSIWSADLVSSKLRRNQIVLSLGHYAVEGLGQGSRRPKPPAGLQGSALSITDEHTSALFKSRHLSAGHLDYLLPLPVQFRRVWAQPPLHVWRAVPPSEDYVALGMVCTLSESPPPMDSLRCVPVGWTRVSQSVPEKVWDDAGCGGQKGSFWRVSSLNLLWAVEGHDMPSGPFYELNE